MVKCALKDVEGKWIFLDPEEVIKIEPTKNKKETKIMYWNDIEFVVQGDVFQNQKFLKSARNEK